MILPFPLLLPSLTIFSSPNPFCPLCTSFSCVLALQFCFLSLLVLLCGQVPSHPNSLWFLSQFLFPVSYLRLLQALLDADLVSAVVHLSSGPGLVGPKPLGVEDGTLYPLGFRGARCLSTAVSGLLLQVWGNDVCLCNFVCMCDTADMLLLVCVTIKGGSLLMISDLHGR